jgi:hypothetical protein
MERKNLLVTLLSDQTIPNVQFIKYMQDKLEKENKKFEHLFVSTDAMERKGVGQWICKVCNISNLQTVVVEHNSLSNIEEQLKSFNPDYDVYYVNVTGGTKIMSMGVSDFFKQKANTRIYYIDGQRCWLNFPEKERYSDDLANNISLKEYIESYGFEIQESSLNDIDFKYTKTFMNFYLARTEEEKEIFKILHSKDDNGKNLYRDKNVKIDNNEKLFSFLRKIDFPFKDANKEKLNKNETRYLTGDWFEEYVYFRLKEEKIIDEENLKTGIHLKKSGVDNEFDVVFLKKGILHTIECKTSISNGAISIINETIYKSTALQKQLGLFTKSYIFTLSLKENQEVKEAHLDRSELMGVKVLCREDIVNCDSMSKLLGLC